MMNMIKEIVKWRPVIIGVILVTALYILSDVISGISLMLPAFLMAGIAVGFMINGSEKNGAINGVILGLIGALVINVILIGTLYLEGYGDYIVSIISMCLIYIVLEILIGAIGGVFGSLIRAESMKNSESAEEINAESVED